MNKYPNMFKQKKTRKQDLAEMMMFLRKHDKELCDKALNLTLALFDGLCQIVDRG